MLGLDGLPRPIGYVLGGGGSLGAIQVGMLQALSEYEVTPDLVSGTSVGALNGAVIAADPKGAANRLSHVWARMSRDQVFPGGLLAQVLLLQKVNTHLFPNTGLAAVIADFISQTATFADLTLPFAAVTTDVATARPHVVCDGPLLPALLASAAIPGIFPPVDLNGHQLYDGGLVANVPMRQAVEMGARSLVVLDCNFPGQLPASTKTIADILLYTAMVAMRAQAVLEAPVLAAGIPVVYLPGPPPRLMSPLDFTYTAALIEAAYEAARSFLHQLRITGPGLYGSPSP
ncbi:patatin-like phospholipase family protein [Mycobacterium paraseoulense]|uniref:Patatin n=1 Tax=Mycobacterium paraseoulense TaxID=590652 RepID=A0A1X0IAR6_9MYCO|nr:patatin-like phospholipase family protein [Mycobacterium paraseoulense]ORB41103.1 patatin [Mycobacterium paraseoulense]